MFAQTSPLGDGRIDNYVIDSSVHVTVGIAVLVTMTLAVLFVGRRALAGKRLDNAGKLTIVAAQLALTAQVLLGIKLLDQGQGIAQLYIHYVGGLIPMGAFLVGGWFVRGDTVKSNRLLAILITIGWFSAIMAFTIGRSYANGG